MKIFEQKKQERKKTLKTPLFIVTAILVLLTNCSKTEPIKPNSTLSDEINNQKYVDILEKRLSTLPEEAQVSIALVTQENTEYIGVINESNTLKTINNTNNIFEIGSITKVFTSIALSSMINNNEVSLSESLQEQFDFPILNVGNITFKHMANHTSGLPRLPSNIDEIENFNPKDPYATYTFNNLKSYLQNHVTLSNPIGSTYEYSNIATGILGYCLAKKRNTTYEELLQELIFKPLNMNSSTTLLNKVNISDLIEPRNINGEIQSHWNFTETTTATGSIKSSVKDMEKFIRKNFENNPVYNLPQQKTFEKETDNYVGLGWGIYESEDFSLLAHDGGTGGFSSILIMDKNKKIGVLILSNVEDYHEKITPMCNDFIIELSKQ
ncbi:serine hydrolase domain-containing protein [Tenacibaculum sp. M341]|uniref:serine hydrolase domain-containing protein n=1 Tax=Tenacibaculum sp. M341 TaxID=2530339 RepID=UPI00104F1C02|nr:serine hydrolase domain-containing protein [Tenacibaculum sp. M341]TCI92278.1 class A beta-lactamase-related serine hydrolase [Tenacibaculum sp. M341]